MALQNDTSRIQYNGNNSTTSSYAIPFVFFENAHIKCVVTSSAGVDTTLALGSGFNVTGAANPNGGSLTTTAAVPTSSKVTIFREVPATQTTSYQEGGDFPAASHERALDKLTMIAQQTKRLADRALKVPETQNNPNDLPNAGTGKKLLGIDNGSITWEDNRQLPAYPAGNTQKLLSAPGGGFAPSWQDAPSIAVGPITSTGSSTPRFIADRFSDIANILDYGADPTGVQDSWLAIQRALAGNSTWVLPANVDSTLTASDTDCVQVINKVWPKLFFYANPRRVWFPKGIYRISRPIVVGPSGRLTGDRDVEICPMNGLRGQFNLIESNFAWLYRTQMQDNIPWQAFGGYDHSLRIENINLKGFGAGEGYNNTTQTPQLAFYHKDVMMSGPGSTFSQKGTGTSGSTTFTVSNPSARFYPGEKFKFHNHSTVYTYVSQSGSTLTITPALTQSVTDAFILTGLPANNGIMVNGGEDAFISQCNISSLTGAGIFVALGTPAPLISNCMVNFTDVAYWMEAGKNTLIQPSGDGNNTFLRTGYLASGTTAMLNAKVEGQRRATTISATAGGMPYPFATSNRSAIEFGCRNAAGPGHLTLIGGSFNIDYGLYGGGGSNGDGYGQTHPFLFAWRDFEFPRITLQGVKQFGYREQFYKLINVFNNNVDLVYKRRKIDDFEDFVTIGAQSTLSWYDDTNWPNVYGVKCLTRTNSNTGSGDSFGFYIDQGSGVLANTASYTRSGTTATFTYYAADGVTLAAHDLQVGDVVNIFYPPNFNNANRLNPNTAAPHGMFTGAMFVKTVPDANTFTTTVLNSGGTTSGGVNVRIPTLKHYLLHSTENGEHIFQMPSELGESVQRKAFSFYDKQRRLQAGLRVPSADSAMWWVNRELALGGNIDVPAIKILHGANSPAASAPDGSLYLRTDGDSSTTLYVRAAGAWKPLASYDP
jgi:hypothetical protein